MLTGADGAQVVTDEAVVLPPANPPSFGQVTVYAHALHTGTGGNIASGDINTTCCFTSVLAKNITAFIGGMNARDYLAVAPADINALTIHLKQALAQQVEEASQGEIRQGEGLFLTACTFQISSNHHVGEEATSVTVTASHTCQVMSYDLQALTAVATQALSSQEQSVLGSHYMLVGNVQVTIMSIHWPSVLVRCAGLWAYHLTAAQQATLASELSGKTAQQAQVLLLQAGAIQHVTLEQGSVLPKDPDYIHFRVIVNP